MVQPWQRNTVLGVDALLAFVAALIALRLSGDLVRRWRSRRAPELAAWAGGLGAYAVAAGALAWGTRRRLERCRVSRLLPRRRASHRRPARSRLAPPRAPSLGRAARARVHGARDRDRRRDPAADATSPGTGIPDAQDVLDLWPARILAILGNSLGTLAVLAVALLTFRARPVGNLLILAGIAVAGIGSGLAGLGVGALAPAIVVAALLLYAGFVAPTSFPKPHRPEHDDHEQGERGLGDRAGNPTVRN